MNGILERGWFSGIASLAACLCAVLLAASTAQGGKMRVLEHIQGPDIGLFNGDFVSEAAGLDTYYSYWIEVPPDAGQIKIRIFDADIGAGGSGEVWDPITSSPNTSVRYTVIDPSGTVQKDEVVPPAACPAGHPSCDDAWITFYRKNNPMVGHWEFRVDTSSSVQTTGGSHEDINALKIKAVDGRNGVELNLYSHTYSAFGNTTGGAGTVTYRLFPWVTCGCEADSNDFDADVGATGSSITVSSRSGATTWTPTASGATTWANNPLGGFTTDSDAVDYGLWDLTYDLVTTGSFPVNWATYYFGQWNAADAVGSSGPPTAQPEANTARIYYWTLGNTKPTKEYLEQMVRWSSGPNPPQVGRTSVFTITVRLVNPTAYPLEFSSTNTVVAYVPGGGAVYAGNVQVAQGTVISQPAIGGTGNVVWNPGTVAAGATVIMAYEVSVTPTSSGQRIPVTGWPGNHGTVATYVDGTCAGQGCTGTQLAGATYSTGELCGLAVTENQLTHAVVRAFRVLDDGGEPVVEWTTGSEAGTLGFRVLRQGSRGLEPVLDRDVPALLEAPQGGVYRVRDVGARTGGQVTYWLEELEAGGRVVRHGPFTVEPTPMSRVADSDWPAAGRSWERRPNPAPHARTPHPGTAARTKPGSLKHARLAVAVERPGMYRLSAGTIASVIHVPKEVVERRIRSGQLRLTNRGREIAWRAEDGGEALVFYGRALDSIFTRDNVYLLGLGPRSGEIPLRDGSVSSPAPGLAFQASLHVEVDRIPATVLGLDPESDYWFWEYLLAGDPDLDHHDFGLEAPDPMDGTAVLTVRLQGASDTGDAEHRAEVLVNGTTVGITSWGGFEAHEASFAFDASLLDPAGHDTVTIYAGGQAAFSLFFVDGFDLSYPRAYRLDGEQLEMNVAGQRVVTLEGSGVQGARIFDISDPDRPVEVAGTLTAEGLSFAGGDGTYVAVPRGSYLEPAGLRVVSSPDPLEEPAEYLVIAPEELADAAAELASYRESQGLSAKVVTVDQIMDHLDDSIFDPRVIRTFLAQAAASWPRPPRFVVFLGPGSLDYRDILGLGGNGMPSLLLQTPSGLYASDGLFADFDGDGVPEIPVGRLPFTDPAQVRAWLQQVRWWEGREVEPAVLAVSDDRDGGADFALDAREAAAALGAGFPVESLGLDDLPVEDLRSRLFERLAQGVPLLEYFGHGGSDRLADEGILTVEDLAVPLHPGEPALVTALTCAVNRFELPGIPCLGSRLLDPAGGGAVAVWAPSGLTARGDLRLLARRFNQALAQPGRKRLGEVLTGALRRFGSLADTGRLRLLFNLLGDPALEIGFAAPAPPDGQGAPDGVPATSASSQVPPAGGVRGLLRETAGR